MVKEGDRTLRSEAHKVINSVLNKEELQKQCRELIIVPARKAVYKTICSHYRGASLLPNTHKIVVNGLF